MSNDSVTSFRRENVLINMRLELESVRAMKGCLQAYLKHLRLFKKNLLATNENFEQLSEVNKEWIDHYNSDEKK